MNAPAQIADQYDFWRRRLKGEVIPIHDGDPQAGFYRNHGDAVAYWFGKDGKVRCRINDAPVEEQRLMELWPFASKKPVTHEAYLERLKSGTWPSESDAVTQDIKDAAGVDANKVAGLDGRIGKLADEAERLLKAGAAKTQEDADRASDIASRLSALWNTADKQREAEKRPHLDKCRDIDDTYRPLLQSASVYKSIKASVVEPFLRVKKAEKDKAEREARDAAAKAQRDADEAARKAREAAAQANAPNELIEQEAKAAAEAAAEASKHAEQVAAQKVHAGTRGRASHLRGKTTVTITHRALLLAHFSEHADITAALQTLAERAVKAGEAVPGITINKEDSAT